VPGLEKEVWVWRVAVARGWLGGGKTPSGLFAGWWMRTSGWGRATEGSGGGSESDCWSARLAARSPSAITVEAVGRNDGDSAVGRGMAAGCAGKEEEKSDGMEEEK